MQVLMFFLMSLILCQYKACAQDGNISNAVYIKHTMSTFKDFDQKCNDISNLVYKHSKEEYLQVTADPNVMNALDLMIWTLGESSRKAILGDNASGKPMRIQFKDLSQISPSYSDFDALGWDSDGQLYIYINIKHKNAPPEAIASLLSHEALHQDDYSSWNEETYAWTVEAAVWTQMKKRNLKLNEISKFEYPLVDRENIIGKMFKDSNYTDKEIRQEVESNPGYTDLPKRSPGFEDNN